MQTMRMIRHGIRAGVAAPGLAAAILAIDPAGAEARELIKNGDFEKKGGLKMWRVEASDRVRTKFFLDRVGSRSPLNRLKTSRNRNGDRRYAIADQLESSYAILWQKFRVPRNARTVVLSFQMFADSFNPVEKDSAPFDLTKVNQHARVDLLAGSARPTSVGRKVVKELYPKGADTVDAPNPPRYRKHRYDLTGDLKPGRRYLIRFSVIATEDNFLLGVDNVSVNVR